jgi:hypothetical protein
MGPRDSHFLLSESDGALFGTAGVMMSVPVALAVISILATLYDEDRSETENTW